VNVVLSAHSACAAPWGTDLLSDIEFELERGQVLGILGPNGAGKTSLLNVLCGATPLTRGELRLAGRPLADWPIALRARAQAVLPQQSPLNFPYTVEEVVLLGRTPHASGAAVDSDILDAVLIATDTTELRQRIYTQLSGGEKQRVQLARVFAQVWREEDSEARVLLLDEPTSALDLSHQKLVMESAGKMANQGCAVAMILHDFNLAARYTDLCLVLDRGRQFTLGSPGEVLTREMFLEVFGVDVHIAEHPDTAVPLVIQS
jgi:iron complex transport system ATP-binding protein